MEEASLSIPVRRGIALFAAFAMIFNDGKNLSLALSTNFWIQCKWTLTSKLSTLCKVAHNFSWITPYFIRPPYCRFDGFALYLSFMRCLAVGLLACLYFSTDETCGHVCMTAMWLIGWIVIRFCHGGCVSPCTSLALWLFMTMSSDSRWPMQLDVAFGGRSFLTHHRITL